MTQYSFSLSFLAILVVSCATSADSAEEKASAVTLESVVAEALAKNPELNYYRAEIAAAKGERRTAGTVANPEFSGQAGAKHARDPRDGSTGDGFALSLSVTQTFEYPGRIALRKAIADRQIALADLGYAQFRTTLATQTRAVAYTMFIAQENATVAKRIGDRFQALSEILREREPAGVNPLLEAGIIEAQAFNAQRRANEAALVLKTAAIKLNQLRGNLSAALPRIDGAQLSFRPSEARERLLALAATNAFELRIRQAELAQQGIKVSLARNERYPAISVGPLFTQEQSGSVGEQELSAGLGFSVPLPLWNRNRGNIEAARAREQQAQASLAITGREVERKVSENGAIYEAKLAELSRWQPGFIGKLREAADVADHHYRLGAVPLTTYVEVQKEYVEGVEAMLKTRAEALQAAQELEILTGIRLYGAQLGNSNR
jgi:cobalt-zinc-cadmium efflux system outer membrane protein